MEQFNRKSETVTDALKRQLEAAGIDTSEWGIGQAKTLDHLQNEIERGETILVPGEAGELLRKVVVGSVEIYYQNPNGKKYRLKEDRQVFKDGRERRRDLVQAVSEKMKADEEPVGAMIRGIQEELGINSEIALFKTGVDEGTITSPSYPGLKSQYTLHKFQAMLNDEQFELDGYIEEQEGLTTYFIWEEVE